MPRKAIWSDRSILEIDTFNDSFETGVHVSMIDKCIESDLGILFKIEGKKYLYNTMPTL